jgi:hypothetical protein
VKPSSALPTVPGTRQHPVVGNWRHRQKPRPGVQGEEYEIAKAEREAQEKRDRFAESLGEKAGHAQYPYLKDPFE